MTDQQIKERCAQYFTEHFPGYDADCGGKWLELLYCEAMAEGLERAASRALVEHHHHELNRWCRQEAARVKDGGK